LEDKDHLDTTVIEGLIAEIGPESMARVLEAMAGDAERLLTGLEHSLATGNPKAFSLYAHSLKSNSLTVGADRVGALFQELETLGTQGALAGVASRVGHAQAEYRKLIGFIVTVPDTHSDSQMTSVG
jgi:histidine phosphotransfer protein HptB